MNRTLSIQLNCENPISNFKSVFNNKRYSKIKISPTLGLKIMKSTPKNPTHNNFSTIPRACPNFLKKFIYNLMIFFWTKLFHIQYMFHHRSKHFEAIWVDLHLSALSNKTKRVVGGTTIYKISM